MSIKKYTNGSWVSGCRKYGTETDTIATLPATVIGDGTPISSYTIKGNMEQSGIPTPSSPIYPSECGERTENLFDVSDYSVGTTSFITKQITLEPNTTYTMSSNCPLYNVGALIAIGNIGESFTTANNGVYPNHPITRTTDANGGLVIGLRTNGSDYTPADYDTMLNLGSTALPYEPYGYKLPLTIGSTTTDIYLGEVQSTRRIKKLVLTGEENFTKNNTDPSNYLYYGQRNSIMPSSIEKTPLICDELPVTSEAPVSQIGITTNSPYNVIYINFGADVMNAQSSGNTVNGFKEYLAAQYANGTPVTIWYIIATPTTGIVNEPIRKIGDYVDSVSGMNLATSGTAQELDVGTTLKPSEVDLTYHGWHEHEDTKFTT